MSKRDIAAVIMEPIICNLGVIIPGQEFFNIVQKTCRKYETVLVIMEKYFEQRLKLMKFRHSADIRVKGLAIGVEFKKKGYATKIMKKCVKK